MKRKTSFSVCARQAFDRFNHLQMSRRTMTERRLKNPPLDRFVCGYQLLARCGADGSARDLGSRGRRFETCHRDQTVRAFGCGRSSMAEPWAVNPLVPVRLRPVTPKRMHNRSVANSSGRVPGSYSGQVRVRAPGDAPSITAPRDGTGRRTGLRSRSPHGMSVRIGPRGPTSSPVAQRQSTALIRRRPVDRAHPGSPTTSDPRPSTTTEVFHETD